MVQTFDLSTTRVFREAKAEGRAEGRAEGKAEGKEETRQEIALRLLKSKISANSVAQFTGLTLRQVQRLRKTLGNSAS